MHSIEDNMYVFDTSDREVIQYGEDVDLYDNRETTVQMCRSADAPLVTIFFQSYNKLEEWTKPALEALLKYTSHLDVELVLVDNGSTDGTLDYFKSISFPRKRICHVTKNLGMISGVSAWATCVPSYQMGRYMVSVPADVIVTQNWLDNLLACMESDKTVGMAVPKANYVSNLQAVDLGFTDLDDMQQKAAEFNTPDPSKWEERIRVIPTAILVRQSIWDFCKFDIGFVHNFSDDDWSFQYRRMGYKLMVCGDTFVYHTPHVTLGMDEQKFRENLVKGRRAFQKKYYGIDAWSDTANFEFELSAAITDFLVKKRADSDYQPSIIGIDVLCGMPLLQVKNDLRKAGIPKADLSAYTEDAKYWIDLKSICSGSVACGNVEELPIKMEGQSFDAILIGKYLDEYTHPGQLIENAMARLSPFGCLVFKMRDYPAAADVNKALQLVQLGEQRPVPWTSPFLEWLRKHPIWSTTVTAMDSGQTMQVAAQLRLEDPQAGEEQLHALRETFKQIRREYVIRVSYAIA